MLGDVGDGTAIFPAQAQTLDHAQGEEEKRGCRCRSTRRWDQADHPRAQPHTGQGDQERVLASRSPSQPKRNAPNGRIRKPSREQRNRAQQSRHRMGLFEELDRHDRIKLPKM